MLKIHKPDIGKEELKMLIMQFRGYVRESPEVEFAKRHLRAANGVGDDLL
jgi:hypothetical protein